MNTPRRLLDGFLALAALLLSLAPLPAGAQEWVPFPIPAQPNPASRLAFAPPPPLVPDGPRLTVQDGRFHFRGDPIRLWGVNLCYGAAMPTHGNAERIAARLAAAGVNSVRLHGLDNDWGNAPDSLWADATRTTVSDEALERLDYFVDQLARRGIHVWLNLHVNHSHARALALPAADSLDRYDQPVSLFMPRLIDAQRLFARALLDRRNRYRGVRYADDPAIALLEIANEHSFFFGNGQHLLRTLPAPYADVLGARHLAWLRQRYPTDTALREAWGDTALLPTGELIRNGAFRERAGAGAGWGAWELETKPGCEARLAVTAPGSATIELPATDGTDWHVQFIQGGLRLAEGQTYTVSARARAAVPRPMSYHVAQRQEPWSNLGFYETVTLGPEWRDVRHTFVANASETDGALWFDLGASPATVELADVSLRAGDGTAPPEIESIERGTIALFPAVDSAPRATDRLRFLAETEKAFFDDMRAFLRNDLGCRAPIAGTTAYGPLGLWAQSDMDFIDAHEYWAHPHFPTTPWDPADWLTPQRNMTDAPADATLWRIAARHLRGKPLTVGEYNHPAPLDGQAECVPLIASFAAAQDLAGVWLFDYSSRNDGAPQETFSDWFDIEGNPAKWGFMRAGAAIFRDAALGTLASLALPALAPADQPLAALAELHRRHGQELFLALEDVTALHAPMLLSWRLRAGWTASPVLPPPVPPDADLRWTEAGFGAGSFTAAGPGALVWIGRATLATPLAERITVEHPDFAVVTLTALDRKPLAESRVLLVTACGRCENTAMAFNAERTSVGRDWGRAPVLIEAVAGRIRLPPGTWTCQALAPDGTPRADVPIEEDGALLLSPRHATMWYLLTR